MPASEPMLRPTETPLPWSWGLAVGLLAAAGAVGPAWVQGDLVGAASGESVAHAWGLTVAAKGMWSHGPFLRVTELVGAPMGWRSDLVDPANLAFFTLFSTVTAWSLTAAGWLIAGALGATALTRRLQLDRWAGLVVVVAWGMGPSLHGGWLPSGRSELWPLLLWPAHLAAVHAALRGGWREAGLAAGLLAVMAHGGWAPLLLLLPWQIGATLLLIRRRADLARAAAIGVGAAVLCVPMLAAHWSVEPWWLARVEVASPLHGRPLGTSVSGLLTGIPADGVGDAGPALAPVLWLGLLGRRRWFALGAVMLLAAMGPAIALDGRDWWSPWALVMHGVAPLRGLHGWPRVAHLAALPLGLALAYAVHGRRRWAQLAVAGTALSGVAVGGTPGVAWPAPLPAEGPVVDLIARRTGDPAQAAAQQALSDRVMVGRWRAGVATSLVPSTPRPASLARSSVLLHVAWGRNTASEDCRRTEAPRLAALGFRSVVVHEPTMDRVAESILGPSNPSDGPREWTLPSHATAEARLEADAACDLDALQRAMQDPNKPLR